MSRPRETRDESRLRIARQVRSQTDDDEVSGVTFSKHKQPGLEKQKNLKTPRSLTYGQQLNHLF